MEVEWFVPITILPGIAILILSTSNLMLALNSEIKEMKHQGEQYMPIIKLKLTQLRRISWAMAGLYTTIFLLALSGIVAGVFDMGILAGHLSFILMISAIATLTAVLVILILYAFAGVYIRQEHLKI